MSLVETIVAAAKPWADVYAASKPLSTTFTFAHIASLVVGAWPALERFGPGFITRIEWDPVNDEYGALIAIAGTVVTSFIALLIGNQQRNE